MTTVFHSMPVRLRLTTFRERPDEGRALASSKHAGRTMSRALLLAMITYCAAVWAVVISAIW
jgi:hypothetical protein